MIPAEVVCGDVGTVSTESEHHGKEEGTHEDDVAERTRRQEEGNPLLNVRETDVEAGADRARLSVPVPRQTIHLSMTLHSRDDTALVDATVELDNELARAVVVNLLKLLDVACRHLARQTGRLMKPTSRVTHRASA